MSDLRVLSGTSAVNRVTADGQDLSWRGTRDGIPYVMAWEQAMAMEGRMFIGNAGTITAPQTWGAGSLLETEPDYFLDVPDNTTCVITRIEFTMEAFGAEGLFEFMAAMGTGGSAGTGTTAVTITNLRSDAPNASKCTATASAATGTATYMTTNISEFFRGSFAAAFTVATAIDDSPVPPEHYVWSAADSGTYPVLVGAAQMSVYAASVAGTGFMSVTWVELPSNLVV